MKDPCPPGCDFIEQTLRIGAVEEVLADASSEFHDSKVYYRIVNQLLRTQKIIEQGEEDQMRYEAYIK